MYCWTLSQNGENVGSNRYQQSDTTALTSSRLDIHPFMSYAAAYTLFNYRFVDPTIGASSYGNLRLIRAFERGLDPSSSEAGFVLTHVDMVKHSSGLIKGTTAILNSIDSHSGRANVVDGFNTMLETMRLIEASMETMWANSKPKDYNTYRTFIFGYAYCCQTLPHY